MSLVDVNEMDSEDLLHSDDTPHALIAGNVDDNSVEEGILAIYFRSIATVHICYCPLFIIQYTELNGLIEEIAPEAKQQQTWQERQENQQESWEHFRPRIFEELLMYSSLPSDTVIKPMYI